MRRLLNQAMRARWVALLLPACIVQSATLRVPAPFSTIQTAMDSVAAMDTISVEVGTYHEALMAPPLPFVLRGNVIADTGDYPRPTIDPAPLPGSDSLSCLYIPAGCAITIEDFRFFNGPAMHVNRNAYFPGGYWNWSEDSVILRRCVFDSVSECFRYGTPTIRNHTTLERCEFTNVENSSGGSKGPLTVVDCRWYGNNQFGIGGRDSVLIERCQFTGSIQSAWVGTYGIDDTIRNCVFGPGSTGGVIFEAIVRGGSCVIENNVMDSIDIQDMIADVSFRDGEPCKLLGNVFSHFHHTGTIQPHSITFGYENPDGTWPLGFVIIGNTFADNNATGPYGWGFPKALDVRGTCEISSNRFLRLLPPIDPVIEPSDTIPDRQAIHRNIFIRNRFATGNTNDSVALDARWNYWGDPSGPYHALTNPQGLGDSLTGNVQFQPWSPDTSFLNLGPSRSTLPAAYSINAFPNPFNSTTRLTLITPAITIVRVELYNILGQRVKDIWSGIVPRQKEIYFKSENLPSGTYLVRVADASSGTSLSSGKLLLVR